MWHPLKFSDFVADGSAIGKRRLIPIVLTRGSVLVGGAPYQC